MKNCLLLLILLFFPAGLFSQQSYGTGSNAVIKASTYPVQVYTQLIPPYTPFVPDYYSGGLEKMKVMLINTDMQQPLLDVFLRMRITSSTFSMQTPPYVRLPFITLQAGVPTTLSLFDLEPFFSIQNLSVTGNQSQFRRTLMLPDNFYVFHFEVYEAVTGRLLSNPSVGAARALIASGDPPQLNFPQKGSAVEESNIPNILFSWTPRHMNSVASAYGTEYELSLVEIYDKQTSVENAFLYSRVIHTETTRSTAFAYSAACPFLQPGLRYAWRVRAFARQGLDDAQVFKNGGYSEIFWFDYKGRCGTVTSSGAVVSGQSATVSWQDIQSFNYTLEYRKKGSTRWYSGSVSGTSCTLYGLQWGTGYEYRIGSRCYPNDLYDYSPVKGFTMPERSERNPSCGIMPDTRLTNRTPLATLVPGLPVFAGDFPVFITEVSGNGVFSGTGYVGLPFANLPRVTVTFDNIVVNTDHRLIGGFFQTKYDIKNNNLLWDIDQTLTGGKGVGDIRTGEERAQYVVEYTINPDIKVKPAVPDGSRDEIPDGDSYVFTKNSNGKYEIVITDSDGTEHRLESDTMPLTVTDKTGNTYQIDEEGHLTPLSGKSDIMLDGAVKNKPRPDIASLVFESTGNTRYALDQYREVYSKVTEYFLKYKPTDEDMISSAKFMIPGSSDEIFVKITESKSGFDSEKVHFITDKGRAYTGIYDAVQNGWRLTVLGSDANDGQNLYVVYEESPGRFATLARLNIYTYHPQSINLTLVPVNGFMNGFTERDVSRQLNDIYNRVGVTIEVTVAENFDYEPLQNRSFDVTGSGLFSTQTADMKSINTAYSRRPEYDQNSIILFIIENVTGNEDVAGDMPRGKQFGYLFNGSTAQTIAHEAGHGIFHLDHPFNRANAAKSFGKGDLYGNVMEYPPFMGNQFVKLQWDAMHSPGLVIGLFEKDEEGMATSSVRYIIPDVFHAEIGCPFGNPFDNGKGNEAINLLIDIFNKYYKGEKYSKEFFYFNSKNESKITAELKLWFSQDISRVSNGAAYCIDDIIISLVNAKNEIDISKREISGDASKAYITIDNAIQITIEEDNKKDSKTVAEYINKAFNLLNNNHFENSFSGGFAVKEYELNDNQKKAIKYFIDTPEGYDFVKQFAKEGDSVMGKKFDVNGDFYSKHGIGLIIGKEINETKSSFDAVYGLLNEKKHFIIKLTTKGFGFSDSDSDANMLKALLHECFIHGLLYINDYENDKIINYDNIPNSIKDPNNYVGLYPETDKSHYHHSYMVGVILKDYKGKEFSAIKGKKYEMWPLKTFEILKTYLKGKYPDNKIQDTILWFKGSNAGVDENNIIITKIRDEE